MAKKNANNQDAQSPNSTEVEKLSTKLSPDANAPQTDNDLNKEDQALSASDETQGASKPEHASNEEGQAVGEEGQAVDEEGQAVDASKKVDITSEVAITETYNDEQMMSRLRSQPLMASEIYGEAQIFMSQNFNIDAILQSQEPILVQNTIEILEKLEHWNPHTPKLLIDDIGRTRELAEHYLMRLMRKNSDVDIDIVEAIKELILQVEEDSELHGALMNFANKLRALLVLKLSKAKDDTANTQLALIKLLEILPQKGLSHMLFDPAPLVRLAIIRHYSSLQSIDLDVMSSSLIILKDSDEEASGALIKMFAKFAVFPELIIPQLLNYMTKGSSKHKQAAIEAIKRYGADAVGPVLATLDEQSDLKAEAVAAVINSMPQRFTDPLITAYGSFHTKAHSKVRLAKILAQHKDPKRVDDIHTALHGNKKPVIKPAQKKKSIPLRSPVLDNVQFYKDTLSDKDLKAIGSDITDSALIELLGDASHAARINALGILRLRRKANGPERACVITWMKSPDLALASAALDCYIALHERKQDAITGIIESLQHNENPDVKTFLFEKINEDQNCIYELIQQFKENPKAHFQILNKIVHSKPSKETIDGIIACISEENSAQCIASSLQLLVRSPGEIDYTSLKNRIVELIENPPSLGDARISIRHFAIQMMDRIGLLESDQELIEKLRTHYKKSRFAEHKKVIVNLLKSVDEEIYEFDDDEDEFDDLRD